MEIVLAYPTNMTMDNQRHVNHVIRLMEPAKMDVHVQMVTRVVMKDAKLVPQQLKLALHV
jgi:hypothetical protein